MQSWICSGLAARVPSHRVVQLPLVPHNKPTAEPRDKNIICIRVLPFSNIINPCSFNSPPSLPILPPISFLPVPPEAELIVNLLVRAPRFGKTPAVCTNAVILQDYQLRAPLVPSLPAWNPLCLRGVSLAGSQRGRWLGSSLPFPQRIYKFRIFLAQP